MISFDHREALREKLSAASATDVMGGSDQRKRLRERPLSDAARDILKDQPARPISQTFVSFSVMAFEMVLVFLTGFATCVAYLGLELALAPTNLIIMTVTALLFGALGHMLSLYQPHGLREFVFMSPRLVAAWVTAILIALAGLFFLKLGAEFSRFWISMWFLAGMSALGFGRMGVYVLMRHWTRTRRLERRAVIIGGGPNTEKLVELMKASRDSDVRILGFFDDRQDNRSPESCAGLTKLGNVDDLVEFGRHTRIDLMLVTLPLTAESRVLGLLKKLWVLPVDVRLSAHTNKLRFRPRSYSYIGNVPFLDVFDRPMAEWDVVAKFMFDRVIGLLALIALLPLMLVTAIAIKLDSKGPVLFRQKRFGFNNELISVFKFRSMYTDQCDARAAKLVTKDDPRVTRVGRFIRKTSIDELPQLFNVVFKGDLSLVGPRPHALSAKASGDLYQDVVDGYFARHKVKPGITGWAQINGWRGETNTREKIQRRVEHDLYYIENWSILFDLKILAMTPISLITKNEGAY